MTSPAPPRRGRTRRAAATGSQTLYNQPDGPHNAGRPRYTSRQAARLSGVPFFTVDYWDRTRFLQPTLAKGTGRGRGRERRYSYEDALRLRIARELRDQHVSLQTLRHVVAMLARNDAALREARYVLVGRTVSLAPTFRDLVALLRDGHGTFGFILDLGDISRSVAERARELAAEQEP